MKKGLLYFLLLLCTSAFSQPEIPKKFLDNINLVKIATPNAFIFKYELSNISYREMMYFAAEKDSALYWKMMPDTAVWNTPLGFNDKYAAYYFDHPAYREYPVVGISYDQAQLFCALLTELFNTQILCDNKELEEVLFRLPTEREWEEAARAGHTLAVYPWRAEGIRNPKTGEILANCTRGPYDYMGVAGQLNDGSDVTTPVDAYYPNDFGLYNMAGNVAEMVAEKGIAKGGSWFHGPANLHIDSVCTYEQQTCWLGFRYVMEVVKYRNSNDVSVFNVKDVVSEMAFFEGAKDPFYISKIETPNAWYQCFLDDIKTTKPSLYETCLPIDSLWRRATTVLNYYHYSEQEHFENYPVVNITHSAALEFCAWLTDKHNNDPKRRFKKVVFELPKAHEWNRVLSNYTDLGEYYWKKYLKGRWEFRMNYHPMDESYYTFVNDPKPYRTYSYPENNPDISRGMDGYELLAPVKAFKADDLGLHNCFGNVAEMLDDSIFPSGGAWTSKWSSFEYGSSDIEKFDCPSPQVGFRVVMRVVEE